MNADEQVLYIVAVRTRAPKGGLEVRAAMKALNDAGLLSALPVESREDYIAIAVARPYAELSSQHHAALVELGYSWDEANQLVTVAAEARSPGGE